MSYLERAITDGHAKLTGEGKQQAVPAPNGGRAQAPDRTPSDRADLVVFRDDERKKPYAVIECKADGVTDAEFNQAVEQACGNGTVAQASAPAGGGSVPLPVHGRATYRGGTPLEPAAGTAALRSNDIQPVSKEALIGAIKKCHQTLWAGGKPGPFPITATSVKSSANLAVLCEQMLGENRTRQNCAELVKYHQPNK